MNIANRTNQHEEAFYQALQEVFVGAKIQGKGGFVNLMKIKANHYEKIEDQLRRDITEAVGDNPKLREELYEKLYDFFHRYFSPSGSVYFNNTSVNSNSYVKVYKGKGQDQADAPPPIRKFQKEEYEKVYTAEQDVALFWKTQNLYYVKSDSFLQDMLVEFDDYKFHFDVSQVEYKRANEKKELCFTYEEVREDTICFNVTYQEGNGKTNLSEILRVLRKQGIAITEEDLERALRLFRKQSQYDFFIHKNAEQFLREQFNLWFYDYIFGKDYDADATASAKQDVSLWSERRIRQLQSIKKIAYNIIALFGQFEDELVEIWNKPKFVRNSNYVISKDKLNPALLKKLSAHKGYAKQQKEWRELGIDETSATAPFDTKYFKDLELEIIGQFDELDEELDGWLIKSENYQALNTILPKFRDRVQCIYIDPPFNTGSDFAYMDGFQDSTWLNLIEGRVELAKDTLKDTGGIFLHLDYNASSYGRLLMDKLFGNNNYINEIIWRKRAGGGNDSRFIANEHDNIAFYANNIKNLLTNGISRDLAKYKQDKDGYYTIKPLNEPSLGDSPGLHYDIKLPDNTILKGADHQWKVSEKTFNEYLKNGWIVFRGNKVHYHHYINIEKDLLPKSIFYQMGMNADGTRELKALNLHSKAGGRPTVKPEKLLNRLLDISSSEGDLVMDFFLGYGTTTAVAHKMGRKWVGVEMGEHFDSVTLPRMKKVVAFDKSGVSKELPEYKGGGFFKYYELEKYEETLDKCRDTEGVDLITHSGKSIYEQYVFLGSQKLLDAVKVHLQKEDYKIDLSKLYKDIDLAETLSNRTGKPIKQISKDKVKFADNTEIDFNNLDYKIIRPLIWWDRKRQQ